jgi:hypothetical protein
MYFNHPTNLERIHYRQRIKWIYLYGKFCKCTGSQTGFMTQADYFKRIVGMNLKNLR